VEICANASRELAAASETLRQWGVAIPAFDAQALIGTANLAAALRATGARVEILDPTLDDYRDAERRACLHLAPLAGDEKSDEMRDLIIWAVALRIAKQDGGAILVAKDRVLAGDLGSEEARAVGLKRAKDTNEAREMMGGISPSGKLAISVLKTVADELRLAGLPLPEEATSDQFSDLQFVTDDSGHANTTLKLRVPTALGVLVGNVHIFQARPLRIQVDLTGLRIGDEHWKDGSLSLTVEGELPKFARPLGERLAGLLDIIKEKL
jgi:hypothetical protein